MIAIDDPLKRTFYEVECIRGNWSARELKGQIGSLYYECSGLSMNKEKLAELVRAGADQFDLAAKERAQAVANIKKNLEVLGYGE